MSPGKRLAKSRPKGKIKKVLAHFLNPNTFLGLFILTVSATVVGGIILNNINGTPDNANSTTPFDSATHSDGDIPSNSIIPSDTPPVNDIADDVIPSNIVSDSTTFNDPAPSGITLNDTISNGTTPKGTTPKVIPITEEMMDTLSSIQQLSIGCSKDWVISKLGAPYFEETVSIAEDRRLLPNADESSKTGEILECVYIYDIVSVMIYFDVPNNSCKAFFITLLEDTFIDIAIPEAYAPLVSSNPLGEFTYSEIIGDPDYVFGFTGQGIARTFYGEKYYFAAKGNYQSFYFANLDYGMLNSLSEFVHFLSVIQFDINPRTDIFGLPSSDLLIQERETFYPNTYGISALNEQLTFDLLSYYGGFDSLPLRGWD